MILIKLLLPLLAIIIICIAVVIQLLKEKEDKILQKLARKHEELKAEISAEKEIELKPGELITPNKIEILRQWLINQL